MLSSSLRLRQFHHTPSHVTIVPSGIFSSKSDSNFHFRPHSSETVSTSWVDVLRGTYEFGSVSLSIDMGHIWSQHAYSYEKAYTGVASLFCKSLGPYIKTLIEYAVWNCMRQMNPVTYLGACIVPMLCEFPQYIIIMIIISTFGIVLR